MARDLTAGMSTALGGSVIRPALCVYLDILTDPLEAWTGPGIFAPTGTQDAVLNGRTFVNVAPIQEMGQIIEDQGIGQPLSLTVSGHDLDQDLLRQIVRDARQWRGRRAYVWLALIQSDEATVIADPARVKTGVMSQMRIGRGKEDAAVTVTIDVDAGRAKSAPWRWLDHPRIFAADTWSTFMIELANQPEGFTDRTITGGDDSTDPAPDR